MTLASFALMLEDEREYALGEVVTCQSGPASVQLHWRRREKFEEATSKTASEVVGQDGSEPV